MLFSQKGAVCACAIDVVVMVVLYTICADDDNERRYKDLGRDVPL